MFCLQYFDKFDKKRDFLRVEVFENVYLNLPLKIYKMSVIRIHQNNATNNSVYFFLRFTEEIVYK